MGISLAALGHLHIEKVCPNLCTYFVVNHQFECWNCELMIFMILLNNQLQYPGSSKWSKACKTVSFVLLASGALIALLALTNANSSPRVTGLVIFLCSAHQIMSYYPQRS